jgi:hypothetical protein
MSDKLNWLTQNILPGSLVLQSWLTAHNISPQLAQKYVKNRSLNKLRSGVYARPGKAPEWYNAVSCLLEQLDFPVHLAGLTSLTHQGKAHYLQLNETVIWLEIPPKKILPLWFEAFPKYLEDHNSKLANEKGTATRLSSHTSTPQWLLITSNKLSSEKPSDMMEIEVNNTKLRASSPELAAFELLGAVPTKISFEHAAEVFQGLTNLSPTKVQSLLDRSATVKSNRLYLFLANYYKHPWFSRIDESTIKLGSGKRQIVTGGRLDNRYQITIPEAFSKNKDSD